MKRVLFYRILRSVLSPLTLWFVKDVRGLDNIPKQGPFVVVANHASYIDPAIVKCLFEKHFNKVVFYLTKKEVYNNPFKKFFFNCVDTIPVDRHKGGKIALDDAIVKLKEGKVIGLFPEGTRSRDGRLHRGKTGAARLALSAKCQIVPIGIIGSYELWPPHNKLPKLTKIIKVKIGKPLTLEKYYNKSITKKKLGDITNDIMIKISKLSNQEYIRY